MTDSYQTPGGTIAARELRGMGGYDNRSSFLEEAKKRALNAQREAFQQSVGADIGTLLGPSEPTHVVKQKAKPKTYREELQAQTDEWLK